MRRALSIGQGHERLRQAFEAHHVRLLRLSLLLADDRSLAEDAVQEVFVRSADRLSDLAEEDVFPYLRAALVNTWKNRKRHSAVERAARTVLPSDPDEPNPDIEGRDQLWRAISTLPTGQRACVILRYYEDLSDAEIAKLLECSVATVKSQSHRALKKLRRVVER